MRYLVVDDSPTMQRVIVNCLALVGFSEVTLAKDGDDALIKLESKPIDFIITDWNMPEMNGLDFVKHVRTNPQYAAYSKLPILMITTKGNKEDILQALQARVNNYLVKPFTPQGLKEKIDAIMSKMS